MPAEYIPALAFSDDLGFVLACSHGQVVRLERALTVHKLPHRVSDLIHSDRLASASRPASNTSASAPLAAPQISTTSATRPPAESSSSDNKPYLTMIVTFALFMSIGANLYLGWTAGEYYSRYRLATERLRSASRA